MTELEKMRKKAAKLTNPTPVELPSGSFRCQITVYGKRYSAVDKDPAIAHAKVNAIRSGLMEPAENTTKITLGQAIDKYIDSKLNVLSPATVRGYKNIRKIRFQELMDVPLSALTQEMLQKAVNTMSRGKSPKTVSNAYGLITAVLGAYRPNFNPSVTLPQKEKKEIAIPTTEEVCAILEHVKGKKYELPIALAAYMGLRTSEIRGLAWENIKGDMIHVKQAMVLGPDGDEIKPTKSYHGDRWLKIPPPVKELLDKRQKGTGLLFSFGQHDIYNALQRACKRLDLPPYGTHDLRHYYASVLLSLSVPDKYAMERMGHSTPNMLKNVYQHTMKDKNDEITDSIDNFFATNLHTK